MQVGWKAVTRSSRVEGCEHRPDKLALAKAPSEIREYQLYYS
jgi:hypothetical protein